MKYDVRIRTNKKFIAIIITLCTLTASLYTHIQIHLCNDTFKNISMERDAKTDFKLFLLVHLS